MPWTRGKTGKIRTSTRIYYPAANIGWGGKKERDGNTV